MAANHGELRLELFSFGVGVELRRLAEDSLELIAKRFGTDHLMVGSDYPFGVMEDPPGQVLSEMPFDAKTMDDVRALTYRRLATRVGG